jgi:hypothetical protein
VAHARHSLGRQSECRVEIVRQRLAAAANWAVLEKMKSIEEEYPKMDAAASVRSTLAAASIFGII